MQGNREQPRANLELQVTYHELNRFFADYTKNISKTGAFIRTSAPLAEGTRIAFQLKVPKLTDPLELEGEVVRLDESGDPGMAIRFLWDDPAQKEAFERKVEALMRATLGPQIANELLHCTR